MRGECTYNRCKNAASASSDLNFMSGLFGPRSANWSVFFISISRLTNWQSHKKNKGGLSIFTIDPFQYPSNFIIIRPYFCMIIAVIKLQFRDSSRKPRSRAFADSEKVNTLLRTCYRYPSQVRDKDLEDNVALDGERDAKPAPLNQLEPSVCEAFLGSEILDCPVTYRASYPPFLELDVEILSFTYLQRGRDKTWRDMLPRAPCLPSIGETIVGTVRFEIALGIAFEVPTSISRSLFLAIFPNSVYMKNWFPQKEHGSLYMNWNFLTKWLYIHGLCEDCVKFIIEFVFKLN